MVRRTCNYLIPLAVLFGAGASLGTTCNTRHPTPNERDALDSAQAVALALEAYRADVGANAIPVVVDQFVRDSAGILIRLGPQDAMIRGGGVLVRVRSTGVAEILERYQ